MATKGRPLKAGLDYFSVDVHNDDKLEAFELMYKTEGVCWWIKMLKMVYATGEKLELHDHTIMVLAAKSFMSVERWKELARAAANLGLIDKASFNEGIITSSGITKRYQMVKEGREEARARRKKTLGSVETAPENDNSDAEAFQIEAALNEPKTNCSANNSDDWQLFAEQSDKVKESKGKERINTPPPPARKGDPIWDTLVEVSGLSAVTRRARTRIGAVVRDLKLRGASPEQIRRRWSAMRAKDWHDASIEALEKHWDSLESTKASPVPPELSRRAPQ